MAATRPRNGEYDELDLETGRKRKAWYLDDKFHRVGGPAVIYEDGQSLWFQYGLLHREDGPAYEYPVIKAKEWRIHGVKLSEEQFNQWATKKRNERINSLFTEGPPQDVIAPQRAIFKKRPRPALR